LDIIKDFVALIIILDIDDMIAGLYMKYILKGEAEGITTTCTENCLEKEKIFYDPIQMLNEKHI